MAFFQSAVGTLQTLVIALGQVLESGVQSTLWKDTVTITQVRSPRE